MLKKERSTVNTAKQKEGMEMKKILRLAALFLISWFFVSSAAAMISQKTSTTMQRQTSQGGLFDGSYICIENPCPRGPDEICFYNTPSGHRYMINTVSNLCATSRKYWAPRDLPMPAPFIVNNKI
jgi:hypothetical protein